MRDDQICKNLLKWRGVTCSLTSEASREVKYVNESYGIVGFVLTKDTNSCAVGNKI